MSRNVPFTPAPDLNARLHGGGKIAVLDAREECAFGKQRLLLASCVLPFLGTPGRGWTD
ncbi:MAG TPA: hypothetical protein VKA18_14090 [Alphaproteobacteria bacterium]|nr:hypothetical protein [Alphaproteobacteria bacterium]